MNVSNPAGALRVARTTLTSAQLLALSTTPVSLIPAPGAGRAIVVVDMALEAVFGTIAYITNGIQLRGVYHGVAVGTNDIFAVQDGGSTALLTAAASRFLILGNLLYPLGSITSYTLAQVSNLGIDLASSTSPQDTYNAGPIVTATVAAGGTGYLLNDTGTIDSVALYSTGDATYQVTGVAGTAVTAFTVTAPGTVYDVNLPAGGYDTVNGGGQPGVGTGFKVNVTAATVGDGTLVATLYYTIVSL